MCLCVRHDADSPAKWPERLQNVKLPCLANIDKSDLAYAALHGSHHCVKPQLHAQHGVPQSITKVPVAGAAGQTPRVKCSWNQTATATGRLSSSSPNLQVQAAMNPSVHASWCPHQAAVYITACMMHHMVMNYSSLLHMQVSHLSAILYAVIGTN